MVEKLGEDDITYNYPNPFKENTKFQFFLDEMENVKLYILNSNGQYIGTLLDEVVDSVYIHLILQMNQVFGYLK